LADARFQYIPIPSWEIVAALAETSPEFTEVSRLLTVIYQLELHAELEQLERAYAPFNPDLDERAPSRASQPSANAAKEFSERLSKILERGNYERLTEADINHAFETRSLFPINVVVDTSVYADFVIYARGETNRSASVPRLYGLARKTIPVPTFDRVCIYIRFKTAAELQLEASELDKQPFEPGTSVLKLFRNIPKADLEMVFPNCRPTMRPIDKLLFGVPALVGGIPVILKLIPAAVALAIVFGISGGQLDIKSLITGLGGLAVLGSYLWRQWDKFKNRRILFGKVLGYVFAQRASEWTTEEELDAKIEAFLRERFGCDIDFEINDALAKIEALGLIERDGEKMRGRPIDEAVTRLRTKLAQITG
jgi:hypothetical protein